jgi:putative membrane protein
MMLSKADHARVGEAVKAAEATTSGEIFCIAAGEVSQYREIPLAWAAAVALIVPPLLILVGLQPWTLIDRYAPLAGESDWAVGGTHLATQTVVMETLAAYAAFQAVLFAVVALIVSIPQVRRALTPRFLKRHRVRRTAYAHFASTGLVNDAQRTGVLVFAALKDRQVEIVADKGIHDAVGDKVWNAACAALVDGMKRRDPAGGFVRAVETCGAALSEHFPATGPHDNRFPDELVEL